MTKLKPKHNKETQVEEPTVVRETLTEFRGRELIIELFSRKLTLRRKGLQTDHVTLYYDNAYESALMNDAKAQAGGIPAAKGRRKARGESLEDAQAKLYPRPARVADGWAEEGRTMQVLGPAIESRGISWSPVQFDDDDDGPDFFKTRGIEFTDTGQEG